MKPAPSDIWFAAALLMLVCAVAFCALGLPITTFVFLMAAVVDTGFGLECQRGER